MISNEIGGQVLNKRDVNKRDGFIFTLRIYIHHRSLIHQIDTLQVILLDQVHFVHRLIGRYLLVLKLYRVLIRRLLVYRPDSYQLLQDLC